MRTDIIGGGAGLATAWLLEHDHDVTLFEKDDRLGGHAHMVDIEVDGQALRVDAGFHFFARSAAYATFNRLVHLVRFRTFLSRLRARLTPGRGPPARWQRDLPQLRICAELRSLRAGLLRISALLLN